MFAEKACLIALEAFLIAEEICVIVQEGGMIGDDSRLIALDVR